MSANHWLSPTDRAISFAGRDRQRIRHILVCLDQSPGAEQALPCAAFVAKTFGASLTLLHVLPSPQERSGLHTFDALGWEMLRREAGVYLEGVQRRLALASGQHVDTRLEQGHPAERIRAVGAELHADLTVLGPYQEESAATPGLGSTAQHVLAGRQGSVLIVHARTGDAFTPSRILLPLDGSRRTESTLPTAVRVAKASGAEILLAHVVPELVPSAVLRTAEDKAMADELTRRLATRAGAYLNEVRETLGREVGAVSTRVARHADQPQALLEIVEEEHVDLIVLSAHGSTCNRERTFGSVSTHLLSHSTVPLLVLQDLSEPDLPRPVTRSGLRSSPQTGGP